eukprot:350255-Chlamydomonas_euryale.AAC.30
MSGGCCADANTGWAPADMGDGALPAIAPCRSMPMSRAPACLAVSTATDKFWDDPPLRCGEEEQRLPSLSTHVELPDMLRW